MLKRNKQGIFILLLILAIILLRFPAAYFWNEKLTGDDASLYMETAINFAEGKGYHCSMLRHISDNELRERYLDNYGLEDRMERTPPVYISFLSGIYLITGADNFLNGINIFNIFLFVVFLILFVRFVKKEFSDDFHVVFLSTFIIGVNFVIFEFTFGAHMESLYILTFFIAFLSHISLIRAENPKFTRYLFYSLALALFLFSKYSAIPFVAAFILHHAFRKDYRSFLFSSFFTFIIVAPWMFVRSYIISGHPFSALIRGGFPFSDSPERSGFGSEGFYFVYSATRTITSTLESYFSLDFFTFLIPFILFFLFNRKEQNNPVRNSVIILFFTSFSFFMFIAIMSSVSSMRYHILLVIPLIPFAVKEMLTFLRNNREKVNLNMVLTIIFIGFGSVQLIKMTEFCNFVRNEGTERSTIINESLSLVDLHQIPEDKTLLVNILGYNVFSRNKLVLSPRNINKENKHELIDTYQVDYVLLAQGERGITSDIFSDYKLVGHSGNDVDIYLYKVSVIP